MKNRYIPAFIMLAAGLVCCVLCVVQRWPVLNSLITLVIVLLLFYIIGQIAAQIVALADVYDALISERAYKKAYPHEIAVQMILRGECGAFSPLLLDCLTKAEAKIREV